MFGRESVTCPNCEGGNVRASKWNSHSEKGRNPGMRPVRCADCATRFMVPEKDDLDKVRIALGAGVAMVILVVVLAAWPDKAPAPQHEAATGVSIAITAEAMKAAEDGDPEAQFSVATSMLSDPELNLAYSAKAVELLQRAAERGHKRAMLRLGLLYRKGVGTLQNFALAAKWIENSAKRGEPQAMLEFGRLYREGVGVTRDPVRAYVWLNRAAAARDPDAVREREEVARTLTAAELKQAQDESVVTEVSAEATVKPATLKPATELAAPR
jgi:uncharacterized protein